MKLPRIVQSLLWLPLLACTAPEEVAPPTRACDGPHHDANNNGVEDAKDIGNGTSLDENQNAIPDEVEEALRRPE